MAGRRALTADEKRALGELINYRPERIRNAMEDKGLSEAQLARKINARGNVSVSASGLHYIAPKPGTRAQEQVREGVLNEIAVILGKPASFFAGTTNEDEQHVKLPGARPVKVIIYDGPDGGLVRVPASMPPRGVEWFASAFLNVGTWRRMLLDQVDNVAYAQGEGTDFAHHMARALELVLRPVGNRQARVNGAAFDRLYSLLTAKPTKRKTKAAPTAKKGRRRTSGHR